MSKNLFLFVVCGLFTSVIAEELAINSHSLESYQADVFANNYEEKEIPVGVAVAITHYDIISLKDRTQPSGSLSCAISLQIIHSDEKTIEFSLNDSSSGSIKGTITLHCPKFSKVLSSITQDSRTELIGSIFGGLYDLWEEDYLKASECERTITEDLNDALLSMVYKAECAKYILELYKNLGEHINVHIDEKMKTMDLNHSVSRASYYLLELTYKEINSFKDQRGFDEPSINTCLYLLSNDEREELSGILLNDFEKFVKEYQQTDFLTIQDAADANKKYVKNIPNTVAQVLKKFCPSLEI